MKKILLYLSILQINSLIIFAQAPANVTGINVIPGDKQLTITWTNSADAFGRVIILAQSGSAVDETPTGGGTTYTANTVFGSGDEIGTGNYIIYNSSDGNPASTTVTGLTNGITYHIKIFAKDNDPADLWNTGASASGIPRPNAPINGNFTSNTCVTDGSITFSAPSAGAAYTYLVFAKPISPISVVNPPTLNVSTYGGPTTDMTDLTPAYEHDAAAILVYKGVTVPGSIALTGLASNVDWASFNFLIYNVDGASYSPGLIFSGTRAATTTIGNVNNYIPEALNQSVKISFDFPSNCFDQVLVVARSGSAPTTTLPVGTDFTADPDFTSLTSSSLNSGKVVYYSGGTPGANESFDVTGLANETTYHFRYFVRKGSVWFVGSSVTAMPSGSLGVQTLSPADNATISNLSFPNAVITFDANVETGSYGGLAGDNRRSARLFRYADDVQVGLTIDRNSFIFSGASVTIPFNATLVDNTSYYILIGENAIKKSPNSIAFSGISAKPGNLIDAAIWNFTASSFQVDAGPDRIICEGESAILLGSVSGGTGFNSYSWSPATGLSCTNCPSPTASPTVTTTYTLLADNNVGSGPLTDNVTVTVNPNVSSVSFIPVSGETTVRTNYVLEDALYELNGSPSQLAPNAVFSGPGVTLKNDNKYYFNPSVAGTGFKILTYTYTNANNCSKSVTLEVTVSSSNVTGLQPTYCRNVLQSGDLIANVSNLPPGSFFSRLRFFKPGLGFGYYDVAPQNPLFISNPLTNPKTYRLNINRVVEEHGLGLFYVVIFIHDGLNGVNPINERLYSWQPFRVINLGPAPEITSISKDKYICEDNEPITLQTNTPSYTTNSYTINDSPGDNSITSNSGIYTFDPSKVSFTGANDPLDRRLLTIIYNYNDFNGCTDTVTRTFTNVKKLSPPIADDKEYCQGLDGKLTLEAQGDGFGFLWYEDSNLQLYVGEGPIFNTGVSSAGAQTKRFYVTRTSYGRCQSFAKPVDLIVKPSPPADFTTPPICKDRAFQLSGPAGPESWTWSFGDGGTDSGKDVSYSYTQANNYEISLSVTSADNCSTKTVRNVTVGLNPIPDFSFNQVCDQDVTSFVGSADIAVDQYEWDFDDGTSIGKGQQNGTVPLPDVGTYRTPGHKFIDGVRQYDVTVTAYTSTGCFDSKTKTVTILEYKTYGPEMYSMANEDSGKGFWSTEDIHNNSTWVFDQPDKAVINANENAWVTNKSANYLPNDRSYVNSPCFNIEGFTKPVIALNYIVDTQESYDGAVLEYSTNGGITWFPLGTTTSGFEWYKTQGFIAGNIGSSQVGWSGKLWAMSGNEFLWLEGKHKLDDIPNKSKVRFRIAFGSNGDGEFEGFAFKNITIQNRNRKILAENFTNQSHNDFLPNNTGFIGNFDTETAKIQYHLSYPGEDNNNRINPVDPAARAAFYGIVLTNAVVPRGYIDGESRGNFISPTWSTQITDRRSLIASPFNINIDASQLDGDYLTITTNIEVLEKVTGNPILHVAVVQKNQGINTYVLRKLLPNAAGTKLPGTLAAGQLIPAIYTTFGTSHSGIDVNDLAVVVFIQDEKTKEVYQAEIENNPAVPGIITNIENTLHSSIMVYPNPADQEFTVMLPGKFETNIPIKLIDSFGRDVYQSTFNKGEQTKVIDTKELAGGVYIIQLETKQGLVRKKVMVVH